MMRLTKIFTNKRAITPVLSTLLLTVIAVAAMAIATTTTYVVTTNLRDQMSERVIIEDVWFNNLTGNINIYLRNVGKVAVTIPTVYVNDTSQSFTKPFNLEINEHGWLNISETWDLGDLCYIRMVTTRGTQVAGYYEAS
jgi:hypothetical protein